MRTFKLLPEFLFRPPSGATFPPGEGIGFACIGRFLTIWNSPTVWWGCLFLFYSSNKQTAWQRRPSIVPVKPSFSSVVALTLTLVWGICRSSAMFLTIWGM